MIWEGSDDSRSSQANSRCTAATERKVAYSGRFNSKFHLGIFVNGKDSPSPIATATTTDQRWQVSHKMTWLNTVGCLLTRTYSEPQLGWSNDKVKLRDSRKSQRLIKRPESEVGLSCRTRLLSGSRWTCPSGDESPGRPVSRSDPK